MLLAKGDDQSPDSCGRCRALAPAGCVSSVVLSTCWAVIRSPCLAAILPAARCLGTSRPAVFGAGALPDGFVRHLIRWWSLYPGHHGVAPWPCLLRTASRPGTGATVTGVYSYAHEVCCKSVCLVRNVHVTCQAERGFSTTQTGWRMLNSTAPGPVWRGRHHSAVSSLHTQV